MVLEEVAEVLDDDGSANKGEDLILRLGETKPELVFLSLWRRLLHAYTITTYKVFTKKQ